MVQSSHYKTLNVDPKASQAEIKRAYRQLVKQFHPDSNPHLTDHETISRINSAYDVVGDPQKRSSYDQLLYYGVDQGDVRVDPDRQKRAADAQKHYKVQRQTRQGADEQFDRWMKQVYNPIDRHLRYILSSFRQEVNQLAADPFDDELMEDFRAYLEDCQADLNQAQQCFRSMPNPSTVAGVAAHLYHCLNQIGDGLEQMDRFTLSYDDTYLHVGQELFRIAIGLRHEAQDALRQVHCNRG